MDTHDTNDDLDLEAMIECMMGDLTQKTEPNYEKAYIDVQASLINIVVSLDKQIDAGIETIGVKNIRDMISDVFTTVHTNLKFNKDYQKEKKEDF